MSDRPNGKVPSADASASESLPVLVGRLGDDLTALVESKLGLLKIELQEDVRRYARRGALTIGGGVVAVIGVGLLGAAAAFFIATVLREAACLGVLAAYALAFASVGLFFLFSGGLVAFLAARKLTTIESAPEGALGALRQGREPLRPRQI